MCINFEFSVLAFIIGELFGYLIYKLDKPPAKMIGLFICFYSLIQLLEAIIYKSDDLIWTKLLYLNLSLQAVVFFYLSKIYKIDIPFNDILLLISIILFIVCCYFIININDKVEHCHTGLSYFKGWPKGFKNPLYYAYCILLLAGLMSKNSKIKITSVVLIITLIISILIKQIYKISDSPGLWCMSSAFASPLIFLVFKY